MSERFREAFARDVAPRDEVEARLHPYARLLRRLRLADQRRAEEAMRVRANDGHEGDTHA